MTVANREPYDIFECTECGQTLEESAVVPYGSSVLLREIFEKFGKPDDDDRRYHRRSVPVSSGVPGMIGCRMETKTCGPVIKRTVGIQEQFVNWAQEVKKELDGNG